MSGLPPGEVLWTPPADSRERTRIGEFMAWLERERGLEFSGYHDLWQWSVDELEAFWQAIWDYYRVISHADPGPVLESAAMPGARWWPGARLNYAEHALRHTDPDQVVIVAESQARGASELTRGQLRDEVARVREGLRRLGVGPGDRVAAYIANIPEAVIGLLATASLGAIWACCPPEFGIQSVLDRFQQIEPKVLLVVDGYRYGDKIVDRVAEVDHIRAGLPSLVATVSIGYLDPDPNRIAGTIPWAQLRAHPAPLTFAALPFDHPLWILFSSGTTGLPKAIVHGHGGIVLEHLKMNGLMMDMGPEDRFFFFSTTAWMVWNRGVSNLLLGGGMAILDGDPTYPGHDALFAFVARAQVTVWGVSATFLMQARRAGVAFTDFDLSHLRAIVGAGSPVPIEGYRYVYDQVESHVHFYSGSGGTDVCSAFVTGSAILPVTAGEIPARSLGVHAEAFDDQGHSVIDEPGELVITRPMPSMPVGFWNDPGDERYRSAYFDVYPGVWRHGDRFVISPRGTCDILGRSDATLNRGGVRLGSGEFYSVVENLAEVSDSLVVHLEDALGGRGELLLFVVVRDGDLDDLVRARIARELRRQRSPRHVPDEVHAVPAIPRTLTGKKLEVPIKRILQGVDPSAVANRGTLADPSSIDAFIALAGRRLSAG